MPDKTNSMEIKGTPVDLYDVYGNEIKIGDTIRFLKPPTAIGSVRRGVWEANVSYVDGVVTIDCYNNVKQVENPQEWKYKHDYIDTRGWCVKVGYGEYGSWNVHRSPLTEIQEGFGWTVEHYRAYYKPLAENYGYDKRFLNVIVV